jgi:hypothetical protein
VKSRATRRFWHLYAELPLNVQALAVKNYHLWRADPAHPSLRFRRLRDMEDFVTVRVGDHHRALGVLAPGSVEWVWIGPHSEYDHMIRGLR